MSICYNQIVHVVKGMITINFNLPNKLDYYDI